MSQDLVARQGEGELRQEIADALVGPDGKRTPIPLHNGVMSPDKWTFFGRLSVTVAGTDFVDKSFRSRPAAIMGALVFGDSLGLHPSASLRDLYVADGAVGMKSELMLALILDAGHNVDFEDIWADDDDVNGEYIGSVAIGERKKRGKVVKTDRWRYTLADAKRAGLYPNSSQKAAWMKTPRVMCRWRALSQLSRFLFPDVFRGQAVYIPDEMEEIRSKDVRMGARQDQAKEIEASIEYGDDPDLAAWLIALFAAASEIEPGKWLPAKQRLALRGKTDEERADLAFEIAEWISEHGVDPPVKPTGQSGDETEADETEQVSADDVEVQDEPDDEPDEPDADEPDTDEPIEGQETLLGDEPA